MPPPSNYKQKKKVGRQAEAEELENFKKSQDRIDMKIAMMCKKRSERDQCSARLCTASLGEC